MPTTFMLLPPEVRLTIFMHLYRGLQVDYDPFMAGDAARLLDISIFFVCRQILDEARLVFLEKARINCSEIIRDHFIETSHHFFTTCAPYMKHMFLEDGEGFYFEQVQYTSLSYQVIADLMSSLQSVDVHHGRDWIWLREGEADATGRPNTKGFARVVREWNNVRQREVWNTQSSEVKKLFRTWQQQGKRVALYCTRLVVSVVPIADADLDSFPPDDPPEWDEDFPEWTWKARMDVASLAATFTHEESAREFKVTLSEWEA
ncbi:uncharacterized protein HMPREF1541_07936 [Cyphellophora europaea CBS 101466]|uniref:Uncharacterized protein n=1 Tax=Cyphellophora europaea (strain CBS 101466) TaxID=1220924 RepID=W2RMN0_CYPE1|nr:uncharacterized protein HMPREF1541_07936 [Cyphellophora europaea CBS 101466]ETN36948.1 hypothetical protein HMPREF1541_07936 [Cyphellophora europaea CBS 101466]